jgi:hypothetical protein
MKPKRGICPQCKTKALLQADPLTRGRKVCKTCHRVNLAAWDTLWAEEQQERQDRRHAGGW